MRHHYSMLIEKSFFVLIVSSSITLLSSSSPKFVSAEEKLENPKDIIAAQIRQQGYTCDNPKEANQDDKLSKPDEKVWILVCQNASYQVKLIPDQAAQVERLE